MESQQYSDRLAPIAWLLSMLDAAPPDAMAHERAALAPPFRGEEVLFEAPELVLAISASIRAQLPVANRELSAGAMPGERAATQRARRAVELLGMMTAMVLVDQCGLRNLHPAAANLRRDASDAAVVVSVPPPVNLILPGSAASAGVARTPINGSRQKGVTR